jgi:hypothetical protein
MVKMIVVIIIVVSIIIGMFLRDKTKMERELKRRGGMRVVYGELISRLLEADPNIKIFHDKPSYISLGVASSHTITLFELVPTFGSVTVSYTVQSKFFGKHKLNWTFPDSENPDFMVHKINTDVGLYLSNKNFID